MEKQKGGIHPGKVMEKKKFPWIPLLLSLLGLAVGGFFTLGYYLDTPVEGFDSERRFEVNSGEPLVQIAQRLESQGFIRSQYYIRAIALLSGLDRSFQKGVYLIPSDTSSRDVLQILTSGEQIQEKVTIPEGYTASQIARVFEEAGITSSREFLVAVEDPALIQEFGVPADSLEGYLFPNTYQFPLDYPATYVVRHLVETFFNQIESIGASSFEPDFLYRKLVLASIVEREYRAQEEVKTIASVFQNRLDIGMQLGSCATIEYIITEIQGRPHPRRIFFRDTEIPSPFNTYINYGLPPAPISNPGLLAIQAAISPDETDYLYFVVNDPVAGTHSFSRNFGEHSNAREAYLQSYVSKF